ncbi:hypothetical protein PANO111632_21710 [Paracoccus nototheniae]
MKPAKPKGIGFIATTSTRRLSVSNHAKGIAGRTPGSPVRGRICHSQTTRATGPPGVGIVSRVSGRVKLISQGWVMSGRGGR